MDGLLQGDYHTLFRGNGVDLAGLREYESGDDVRYIDWNVTARLDTPYVREYHEDRELTAWFLLDLSPSVDFGTADAERVKRTVLIDFVATMARLLTRRGNRVGAVLYGRGVERTIPAAGRPGPGPAADRRPASHPRLRTRRSPTLARCSRPAQQAMKTTLAGLRDLGLHQRARAGSARSTS